MSAASAGSVPVMEWTITHALHEADKPPGLRTDCPGTFRIEENDGKRPAVAVCDDCGAMIGVRQDALTERPAPAPAELW